MKRVERDLDPSPSYFKGNDLPVEQVSWLEAVEFCRRLSKYKGKNYRLPSEAEWEYACRAGTTTPFCFGKIISTEQANYDGGNYTYNDSKKGEYRGKTTLVGSFSANQFGLYDMHGNVWEWCQDYWHENYNDAPNNGSSWSQRGNSDSRVRRGGSWYYGPRNCRSACRADLPYTLRNYAVGFRIVCSAPRTLS